MSAAAFFAALRRAFFATWARTCSCGELEDLRQENGALACVCGRPLAPRAPRSSA